MLETVDLKSKLTEEEFDRRAPKAKRRLVAGLHRLTKRGRSLVVAFEGWDAAGKGGCIRRLVAGIDPRLYDVHPIAAPTPEEKAHHNLWRFGGKLPDQGRAAIFDRTWYGRVLVERVEGFATEVAWQRSYEEINEFERHLTEEGILTVKFWLHIDQKTQQQRFAERQQDPLRAWKFTPDDLRNRDKWGLYQSAIEDMLARTDTAHAPWHLVPSVDKRVARLCVIDAVADALEAAV
jgi:polyphosphate kinase 2 (PPK2 family)